MISRVEQLSNNGAWPIHTREMISCKNCVEGRKCTLQSVRIVPNCKCFEKFVVTGNQAEDDQEVTGNTVF